VKPFEYQFYVDVEGDQQEQLDKALKEVRAATSELRVLGLYLAARR
jgi:prephenate dehydratase